jgi:hypothetical protein
MKPLTRDISITLIVKLLLLITLWWVCFKGVEKPSKDPRQWLLGSNALNIKQSIKTVSETYPSFEVKP